MKAKVKGNSTGLSSHTKNALRAATMNEGIFVVYVLKHDIFLQ